MNFDDINIGNPDINDRGPENECCYCGCSCEGLYCDNECKDLDLKE